MLSLGIVCGQVCAEPPPHDISVLSPLLCLGPQNLSSCAHCSALLSLRLASSPVVWPLPLPLSPAVLPPLESHLLLTLHHSIKSSVSVWRWEGQGGGGDPGLLVSSSTQLPCVQWPPAELQSPTGVCGVS